jgi:hypothetical protein
MEDLSQSGNSKPVIRLLGLVATRVPVHHPDSDLTPCAHHRREPFKAQGRQECRFDQELWFDANGGPHELIQLEMERGHHFLQAGFPVLICPTPNWITSESPTVRFTINNLW